MLPIKEVTFERTFDAPIKTVWQAWTDPEILKKWWGPDNVNIPECEVDLKVGGRFYIVMEASEAMGEYQGTRWPMEAKYTLVEPETKLTYDAKAWTENQEEATAINQVSELNLSEANGKTKLKLKITVNKLGPETQMAMKGMQMGFSQMLEKLNTFFMLNSPVATGSLPYQKL